MASMIPQSAVVEPERWWGKTPHGLYVSAEWADYHKRRADKLEGLLREVLERDSNEHSVTYHTLGHQLQQRIAAALGERNEC